LPTAAVFRPGSSPAYCPVSRNTERPGTAWIPGRYGSGRMEVRGVRFSTAKGRVRLRHPLAYKYGPGHTSRLQKIW
jgi:hypothetical protein